MKGHRFGYLRVAIGVYDDITLHIGCIICVSEFEGKRGKLGSRKTLFDRWILAYPVYLKPKLLMVRFLGNDDWWKDIQYHGNRKDGL